MDPVIAEINDLCKTPRYYRWADKMVRLRLAFWHWMGWRLWQRRSAPLWNAPILLFGWSENFRHQGPEHGHIDNYKRLADCTNNKEVCLTVLRAHSRESHLRYLRSLEADLADAAQEQEGDGADESVTASAVDREGEAGACELWPPGSDTQHFIPYTLGNRTSRASRSMISYLISYDIISYICRNSKQRCIPSLCLQGELGCVSSQASPLGYPSRATRCRLCR
jgi:hypothetical protein